MTKVLNVVNVIIFLALFGAMASTVLGLEKRRARGESMDPLMIRVLLCGGTLMSFFMFSAISTHPAAMLLGALPMGVAGLAVGAMFPDLIKKVASKLFGWL